MRKDYITIATENHTIEKMEVVATFKLADFRKSYIIYKDLNNKYYAASYNDELNYSNLNTDFSEEEKKQLNEIFEVLSYGG